MSSPTWTRTRTPLVLALAIVTAAACVKTTHAQNTITHDIGMMAEILSQVFPQHRPAIEKHTIDFKESTLKNVRNLMDPFFCNKTVGCGKTPRKFAISLVPQRRQNNSASILIMENSQKESDIRYWTKSLDKKADEYEDYQLFGRSCNNWENWGYDRYSPCIIVEMNKIVNWVPDVYTNLEELPTDMPEDLKAYIKEMTIRDDGIVPKRLWLNCKGQTPDDDDNLSEIKYTPWQGFPAFYFPYTGNDEWKVPMVAVRFVRPAKNVLINIECRVYSKDISHSRYDSDDDNTIVGVMNFELLVD